MLIWQSADVRVLLSDAIKHNTDSFHFDSVQNAMAVMVVRLRYISTLNALTLLTRLAVLYESFEVLLASLVVICERLRMLL